MPVTLNSTGITFSDATTQNTAAVGGTSIVSDQTFNSTGNWSKPNSGSVAFVEMWGGGGGGQAGNNPNGGGGGGGGTYKIGFETFSNLGSNETVTVGAGGNSGGGQGGDSDFGNITALGGQGGINTGGASAGKGFVVGFQTITANQSGNRDLWGGAGGGGGDPDPQPGGPGGQAYYGGAGGGGGFGGNGGSSTYGGNGGPFINPGNAPGGGGGGRRGNGPSGTGGAGRVRIFTV